MGQQMAACSSVCSLANAQGAMGNADQLLHAAPPQVKLLAWLRRRNGPDCDFSAVFVELYGCKEAVGCSKFAAVLEEHGFHDDAKGAFKYLDRYRRKGAIGAAEFEAWQSELEDREMEGLKHLRDFLKNRFPTPSAAYKALGKGEGDVLTLPEFIVSMQKVGFTSENPEELFRFIDKDFSGEVTFSEFKTVMRNAGNRFARKGTPPNSRGCSPRRSPNQSRSPQRSPTGSARRRERRRTRE
mmetsp:Transcript_76830/g.212300  ORF Transcript_76830/g.212300 Transcript_76830/m.212300 type:complete len:241 (-) Transcript_76830:116-838(-)